MEAEVSATLEACTCVFLTTFCTLMLISCMVLVTSSIAGGPHELLQTVGHAKEGVAEGVAPGAGHDFDGQIAFGNRHGNAGHLLEVSDHVVEGGGESANFVIAVNVDVLIEIAGVADFTGDGNEV